MLKNTSSEHEEINSLSSELTDYSPVPQNYISQHGHHTL